MAAAPAEFVGLEPLYYTPPSLKDILKRRYKRLIWTSLLVLQYELMTDLGLLGMKPDLIIAGLPVYHVNKMGHGASDEIMKYRSTGGIFLAHQRGGKHTFKFTAKLFGPNRYLIVKALETLQRYGAEEAKSIIGNLVMAQQLGWSNVRDVDPKSIIDVDSGSDLINYTKHGDIDDQEYITHRTYPIITDTKIYMDMYMETMTYSRDIKHGANVIEVNCLFRKFTPPLYYQSTVHNPDQKRTKKYYRTFISEKELVFLKRWDYIFNVSWSFFRMARNYAKYYEQQKRINPGQFSLEISTLASLFVLHMATGKIKYG